jgi:hypothetical protein
VDGRAVFPPDGVLRFVTVAFYPTELRTADVVTYGYPEVRMAVFAPLTVIYPYSYRRTPPTFTLRLLKVLFPEGEHGVVALNERRRVDEAVLAHGKEH